MEFLDKLRIYPIKFSFLHSNPISMNYLIGALAGIILVLCTSLYLVSNKYKDCTKDNKALETQILMLGQASTKMMAIVHSRDSLMKPLVEKSKLLNEKYNTHIDTAYIGDMDSLLRELTTISE